MKKSELKQLIKEEIIKILKESLQDDKISIKNNKVEIITNLYYIEEKIKNVSENLYNKLEPGGLMTSEQLSEININPINLKHPIYGNLKKYIYLYLEKGTIGKFLEEDPETFVGGGQETTLDKSWYKLI